MGGPTRRSSLGAQNVRQCQGGGLQEGGGGFVGDVGRLVEEEVLAEEAEGGVAGVDLVAERALKDARARHGAGDVGKGFLRRRGGGRALLGETRAGSAGRWG